MVRLPSETWQHPDGVNLGSAYSPGSRIEMRRQLAKHLPCPKCEDQSLDPQNPHRCEVGVAFYHSSLGRQRQTGAFLGELDTETGLAILHWQAVALTNRSCLIEGGRVI